MQCRYDASPDRVNRPHHFRLRQRRGVHLERDARDPAQRLAVPEALVDHFVRATNQQCAVRTSLRVEARACHRRPPAFLSNIRHRLGIARIKRVGSLLRGVGDVTQHVDTNFELPG